MRKMSKKSLSALMVMLVTSSIMGVGYAEEKSNEELDTYTLDNIVVTATRYGKRDVDVAASTEVLTSEDIKNTGAQTAAAALSKVQGMAYKSFGPGGANMGTMTNEVNIRGIDNGTLILLNGKPISWRGKYNLEAIPADSIERIEIVKGGGSVLYGSDAMGGVVNIITKKKGSNSVSAGFGNYGQKVYSVNVGGENFTVNYSNERWQKVREHVALGAISSSKKVADTATNFRNVKKENIGVGVNITDELTFNYNYYESDLTTERVVTDTYNSNIKVGDIYNYRDVTNKQHITQMNYEKEGFKAGIYYNTADVESRGYTYFSTTGKSQNTLYNTRERNDSFGADVQNKWEIGEKTNLLFGASWKHEAYKRLYTPANKTFEDYSRNNFGIYGQWEQQFDPKNSFTVSARETWTTGAPGGQNYSNFSAAGQFMHSIGEDNNLYLSIGQSFIMPTFSQMYGASDVSIANPGLKPQKGVSYELGWKKAKNNHFWKAALYRTTIKDNISATWNSARTDYTYLNEDFKNMGIELTCTIKPEGPFSYNYGVGYSNPKVLNESKGYWDRKFGRVNLTGGIGYEKDKFRTYLSGAFLGERVGTPSNAQSSRIKPYFLTSLSATYSPDKHSDITLTVDNVLNRNDNLVHSGTVYSSTPINFLLNYTYKF